MHKRLENWGTGYRNNAKKDEKYAEKQGIYRDSKLGKVSSSIKSGF